MKKNLWKTIIGTLLITTLLVSGCGGNKKSKKAINNSPIVTKKNQENHIFYNNFYSPQLKNYRDIIVYLPPSYHHNSTKYYPVLYFQDGNNLFSFQDAENINLDRVLTELYNSNEIHEAIIVGICVDDKNENRDYEYSPTPWLEFGGGGKKYGDFVVNTVKPFINSKFRTLLDADNNGIIGVSLGGLISLSIACQHPNQFGMVGAMSPTVVWDDGEIVERIINISETTKIFNKLWLDVGVDENIDEGLLEPVRDFKDIMTNQLGYTEAVDFKYYEALPPYGKHEIEHFAHRIHLPIKFFLGK